MRYDPGEPLRQLGQTLRDQQDAVSPGIPVSLFFVCCAASLAPMMASADNPLSPDRAKEIMLAALGVAQEAVNAYRDSQGGEQQP